MHLQSLAASIDEENFLTMQKAYTTCMDETALKKIGVAPLVELIEKVAEKFPVNFATYDNEEPLQQEDYAQLSEAILLLEQLGVSSFEALFTGADDKNPVGFTHPLRQFHNSH